VTRLASTATLIALGTVGAAFAQPTPATLVLITEAEAKLPAVSTVNMAMRAGVTRGPKIILLSPVGDGQVGSPLHLRLKFESFGGAKIDLSSVKVTYLKNPAVRNRPKNHHPGQQVGLPLGASRHQVRRRPRRFHQREVRRQEKGRLHLRQ
jgi:hypothetical protein